MCVCMCVCSQVYMYTWVCTLARRGQQTTFSVIPQAPPTLLRKMVSFSLQIVSHWLEACRISSRVSDVSASPAIGLQVHPSLPGTRDGPPVMTNMCSNIKLNPEPLPYICVTKYGHSLSKPEKLTTKSIEIGFIPSKYVE